MKYYLLRRTLPLLAFLVFNYMERKDINQIPVKRLAATFTIGYLILGLATRYIGPIQWGLTQVLGLLILSKSYNIYYAANLSLSAVMSMSWLYELPWFHSQSMFISNRTYLPHIGLICTLITLGLLHRTGFKPSVRTGATLAFFVLWEIMMVVILVNHWNPIMRQAGFLTVEYYVRLGGSVALLSLFHEMRAVKERGQSE